MQSRRKEPRKAHTPATGPPSRQALQARLVAYLRRGRRQALHKRVSQVNPRRRPRGSELAAAIAAPHLLPRALRALRVASLDVEAAAAPRALAAAAQLTALTELALSVCADDGMRNMRNVLAGLGALKTLRCPEDTPGFRG